MRRERVSALLAIVLLSSAMPALAQTDVEKRLNDLERRVEQLEKQSGRSASAGNRSQVVGGQDGWRRIENWRALKRGMTQAEVRGLLGEPHRVDAGSVTSWYYDYPIGGDLLFAGDGRLHGWSEPRR